MVLCAYFSNYESSAYRSGTQVRHRHLSQCNYASCCLKRQTSTKLRVNWTNIAGAEHEFTEYGVAWNKERIEEHLIQQEIRWKFKQTAATHFGGLWERLVRRSKVISHRGIAFHNDEHGRAEIQSKTVDPSQFSR